MDVAVFLDTFNNSLRNEGKGGKEGRRRSLGPLSVLVSAQEREGMATTWNFRSEGLTVNFCPECGSLLELPKQIGNIECSMCKYSCTFAGALCPLPSWPWPATIVLGVLLASADSELDLGVQTIVTKSSKIAAPSSQLRRGALEDKETRATVGPLWSCSVGSGPGVPAGDAAGGSWRACESCRIGVSEWCERESQ